MSNVGATLLIIIIGLSHIHKLDMITTRLLLLAALMVLATADGTFVINCKPCSSAILGAACLTTSGTNLPEKVVAMHGQTC
jgi:hypothetical protein